MKVYQHNTYEEYVKAQTICNKAKVNWVYAHPSTIETISKDKKEANFIICHGTRNGAEQKFFQKHFPNAYIIGTEISDNALQFEMTVRHDFSIQKKEWIDKADIVYSNSFDHTNDPQKTILTWKDQLSPTGKIYMEYNEGDSVCEPADCLDARESEIIELIKKNGLNITNRFRGSKGSTVLVCERKDND